MRHGPISTRASQQIATCGFFSSIRIQLSPSRFGRSDQDPEVLRVYGSIVDDSAIDPDNDDDSDALKSQENGDDPKSVKQLKMEFKRQQVALQESFNQAEFNLRLLLSL